MLSFFFLLSSSSLSLGWIRSRLLSRPNDERLLGSSPCAAGCHPQIGLNPDRYSGTISSIENVLSFQYGQIIKLAKRGIGDQDSTCCSERKSGFECAALQATTASQATDRRRDPALGCHFLGNNLIALNAIDITIPTMHKLATVLLLASVIAAGK